MKETKAINLGTSKTLSQENRVILLEKLDYLLSTQNISEKEVEFSAQEFIKSGYLYETTILLRRATKKFVKNILLLKLFATVLNRLNYFDEALQTINTLLALEQTDDVLIILGNIFEKKKEYNNALKAYVKAKEINKSNIYIYMAMSRVFKKIKRLDLHLEVLKEGVIHNENSKDMLLMYGNELFQYRNFRDAEKIYRKILEIDKNAISALINLGVVKKELAEFEASHELYQRAIALSPKNAGTYSNLGVLYKTEKKFFDAYKVTCKALSLDANSVDAYANMGAILKETNKPKWAEKYFKKALECNASHVNANLDYGIIQMLLGNYKSGLVHYEFRTKLREFLPKLIDLNPMKSYKKGESISKKRILVIGEQGFGDAIQFVRFLTVLKAQGAYVIIRTRQELKKLFEVNQIADKVILEGEKVSYDYHLPLLSIPYLFDIDPVKFEHYTPYLSVLKTKNKDKKYLKKVAFAFGGSKTHKGHSLRYINPENFAFLCEQKNIEIYTLQMGEDREKLLECSFYKKIIDNTGEIDDFYDSASVLSQMDLLITSDTSIGHLGGALGVKTWICLPSNPDWRWGRIDEKTFWYPNVTLFRQSSKGKWSDVFEKMKTRLAI